MTLAVTKPTMPTGVALTQGAVPHSLQFPNPHPAAIQGCLEKAAPEAWEEGRGLREREAHIKDLEASDVQDPDEQDVLPLGLVQSLADVQDQPVEHALISGLG